VPPKNAAAQSVWCVPNVAVAASKLSVRHSLIQCKPRWVTSVQTATPRSVNAKKTAKKPSKLALWAVRAPLAADHAAAVQPVVALVAAARVAATLAVQVVTVAEAADKSKRRCTKNACSFKGNPLKRLK
jgi:hypothetical protein